MSQHDKMEIIRLVESSELSTAQTLSLYGVSSSTYYRWKHRLKTYGIRGLIDNAPHRQWHWNRLTPEEEQVIIEVALLHPEWSPREISLYLTDAKGMSISESTVYCNTPQFLDQ
jgi:putative transposase